MTGGGITLPGTAVEETQTDLQNSNDDVIAVHESRENETTEFTVTVEVEPEPAFEIDSADADVQVGESGDFTIEPTDTGGGITERMSTTASGVGALVLSVTPLLAQFGVLMAISVIYCDLCSITVRHRCCRSRNTCSAGQDFRSISR